MEKQLFLGQVNKFKKIQYITVASTVLVMIITLIISVATMGAEGESGLNKIVTSLIGLWIPFALVSGASTVFGTMEAKAGDQRFMILSVIGSVGLLCLSLVTVIAIPVLGVLCLIGSIAILALSVLIIVKCWDFETRFY